MQDVPRDHLGFEAFYRTYRPLVFSVSMGLLRNVVDAEDVVQRIFLKAWKRPDAFRGGNVESWLTSITKNACFDDLRTAARRSRRSLDAPCNESIVNIEEEAISRVLYASATEAIKRLTPHQRGAVIAAFVDARTHASIAFSTDVPLGTVKTRIRSGIAELRRVLREAS